MRPEEQDKKISPLAFVEIDKLKWVIAALEEVVSNQLTMAEIKHLQAQLKHEYINRLANAAMEDKPRSFNCPNCMQRVEERGEKE